MSLWKFIEDKLAETGKDERWLADECGFTVNTVNRIRHGGAIKDGTKQKIALALKCSVGDINAAIAQKDVPQSELTAETKEIIDTYMREPQKIPAEKIKWYPDQPAIDTPQIGPVAVITEPKVTVLDVEAYKQKLKNVILEQVFTFDDTSYGIEELFGQIGKALMKELMS